MTCTNAAEYSTQGTEPLPTDFLGLVASVGYYQLLCLVMGDGSTRRMEQWRDQPPREDTYYVGMEVTDSRGTTRWMPQCLSPSRYQDTPVDPYYSSIEIIEAPEIVDHKREAFVQLVRGWNEAIIYCARNPYNPVADESSSACSWNRRGSSRIDVHQPVRFKSVSCTESVIGSVTDLSAGGVFIRTPKIPDQGALVAFGFNIRHRGHKHVIRCMGQVVWVTRRDKAPEPGFGLRFIDPSSSMIDQIRTIVTDSG